MSLGPRDIKSGRPKAEFCVEQFCLVAQR